MNRGARRLRLFEGPDDYVACLQTLTDAMERVPIRLLAYVLMPNHWHLVLWPAGDHDLSSYMAWMTATHVRRWHLAHDSSGTGTLYQGRYKAVPVETETHLLTVCRYVERNPVRAGLAARTDEWTWSSGCALQHPAAPNLHEWPLPKPPDWTALVNAEEPPQVLEEIRTSLRQGIPLGTDEWRAISAGTLGWAAGQRPRGRPPATGRRK